MLDRGEKCKEICKANEIIKCPQEVPTPESPADYTGFCAGNINTGNATQCPNLEKDMKQYKNVVFETKLIDSELTCPDSEDKCIFQCNT
jgi:hypothetical protein